MPSSIRPKSGSNSSSGGGRTLLPVTPMSERQQMALVMQMTSTANSHQGTSRGTSTHHKHQQLPHHQQHGQARFRERNERGETPLHLAAIRGDVDQVERLLAHRTTDPNAVDFAGWTPLHEACNHGWREVASKLLQAGALVNARGLDDETPLHDAAANGHKSVVRLLLEHGADVHAKNRKGRTPYDVATVDVAAYIREHTSPPTTQQTESNAGQRVQPRPRDDKKLSGDSGGGNKKSEAEQQQSGVKSASSDDVYEFKSVKDSGNSNNNANGDGKGSSTATAVTVSGTDPLEIHGVGENADALASGGTDIAMVTSGSTTSTSSTASVGGGNNSGTGASSDDVTTTAGNKRTYGEVSGNSADMADDPANSGADEESRRKKRKDSDSVKDGKTISGSNQSTGNRTTVQTGKTGPTKPGSAANKNNTGSVNSTVMKSGSAGVSGNVVERKTSPCSSPKPASSSSASTSAPAGPGTATTSTTLTSGGTAGVCIEGAGEQDDSRVDLKVPPLKIVIPQGSAAAEPESGGTRAGKSSSQRAHHQALPYVVTSGTNTNSSAGGNELNTTSTGQQLITSTSGTVTNTNITTTTTTGSNSGSNDGTDKENNTCTNTENTGAGQSTQPSANTSTKTNNEDSKPNNNNSGNTGPHEDQKTSGGHHQRVLRSSHRSSGGGSNTGGTMDRHSNNSSPLHQQQRSPSPNNSPASSAENTGANSTGNNMNSSGNNSSNSNNNNSNSGSNTSNSGTGTNHVSTASTTDTNKSPTASGTADMETAGGTNTVGGTQQQQSATSGTTGTGNSTSATGNTNTSTTTSSNVELHPRKRKMRPNKDTPANQTANTAASSTSSGAQQQTDTSTTSGNEHTAGTTATASTTTTTTTTSNSTTSGSVLSTEVHPHEQPITNCYQLYLNIRRQIERRRKSLFPVQPKPPQGFKDYLMNRCTYVLAGTAPTVPTVTAPATVPAQMRELYGEQERERYRLRMQHVIEKEKLVLSVEQEILRVHGRAARALANQSLPFSVCTVLRDEEVYNVITPEQEEKDRNARSRYNGRLFLSWLQDVDDKWEKIKEHMLLRHHNEAESLHAVQRMAWEWALKEQSLCEYKARPHIDDIHVPQVHVSDDFDLLPA